MLENFKGNKRVVELLKTMLFSGQLPHAILIEGDEGVGKRTLSRELAKSILCMEGNEYCNSCRSCTLFEAGSNPDFKVVAPEKNLIKVDVIRELREQAYRRPDRCERKVYIIESAEKMNIQAQNAFLKILEEPPQYVVFILLSCSSAMLLDTIISRCTRFSLNTPDRNEAAEVVLEKCPNATAEQINNALDITDNNIGKALSQLNNTNQGDTALVVEQLLSALSHHRSYELLKILSVYKWYDLAGFSMFLNLLCSRISVELRQITLGATPTTSLSRQELIKIFEVASNTLANLRSGCNIELATTCFCSKLNK